MLRRPPDPLDPVWAPGATPVAVLRAMAGEGLLVELLPLVWVPADLAPDPHVRAAALRVVLDRAGGRDEPGSPVVARAVVGLAAAAWLHGCPGAPAHVDLLVPGGTGSRALPPPLRLRRVADPLARTVRLGPLRATDPERTREDLRRAGRGLRDAGALRWLEGASARPSPPLPSAAPPWAPPPSAAAGGTPPRADAVAYVAAAAPRAASSRRPVER